MLLAGVGMVLVQVCSTSQGRRQYVASQHDEILTCEYLGCVSLWHQPGRHVASSQPCELVKDPQGIAAQGCFQACIWHYLCAFSFYVFLDQGGLEEGGIHINLTNHDAQTVPSSHPERVLRSWHEDMYDVASFLCLGHFTLFRNISYYPML